MSGSGMVRWVQQDWLRAPGTEPALFVFDDETVADYSLKRIGFLYESLLELPVEICRGSYETALTEFLRRHGASGLVTTATPDPRVRRALERLAAGWRIQIETTEPFVNPGREPDLKRFSRYWSRVEPLLLPAARPRR